jgi:hypothetical protein
VPGTNTAAQGDVEAGCWFRGCVSSDEVVNKTKRLQRVIDGSDEELRND